MRGLEDIFFSFSVRRFSLTLHFPGILSIFLRELEERGVLGGFLVDALGFRSPFQAPQGGVSGSPPIQFRPERVTYLFPYFLGRA